MRKHLSTAQGLRVLGLFLVIGCTPQATVSPPEAQASVQGSAPEAVPPPESAAEPVFFRPPVDPMVRRIGGKGEIEYFTLSGPRTALNLGMSPEQVRQYWGEPQKIKKEGLRQLWDFGLTRVWLGPVLEGDALAVVWTQTQDPEVLAAGGVRIGLSRREVYDALPYYGFRTEPGGLESMSWVNWEQVRERLKFHYSVQQILEQMTLMYEDLESVPPL